MTRKVLELIISARFQRQLQFERKVSIERKQKLALADTPLAVT